MDYKQALSLLSEGKKVRLPEWTGYWFHDPTTNQTLAFTRTGGITLAWSEMNKTPHDYQNRDDWEEVTQGMGFDFAILALKAGRYVRRPHWLNTAKLKNKKAILRGNRIVTKDMMTVEDYKPTQADMLATDWQIVD